jgi:Galactose oxidase, central domain
VASQAHPLLLVVASQARASLLAATHPSNSPSSFFQQSRLTIYSQLPPQQHAPPTQSQSQPPPPPQKQTWPVYPWAARRLNLLPLTLLNKNAPPSGPSPSPFPRHGHALPATATAASEVFLFGGLVHESARNDLHVFSTRDLSATLLQTSGEAGEVPTPRVGHAGAHVGSLLLIWGRDTKVRPSHLVAASQPRPSPLTVVSQPQASSLAAASQASPSPLATASQPRPSPLLKSYNDKFIEAPVELNKILSKAVLPGAVLINYIPYSTGIYNAFHSNN